MNLKGAMVLIRLELNIDQVGTNNVITHVPNFDAKMRRNEQLCHTLGIGNMFGSTHDFKNS